MDRERKGGWIYIMADRYRGAISSPFTTKERGRFDTSVCEIAAEPPNSYF